jgi:hypothetical protein
MSRTFKTARGTELPILSLRGKDYLEVKYRLVWFREEHPAWTIETEFVSIAEKSACARATIREESGRVIATSHKFESEQGFPDFLEKAETGAIGRALALIGYGTQFCADELDEGERIVDAPVSPGLKTEPLDTRERAGNYEIQFGKKYRGRKIREVPREELQSYLDWLTATAERKSQEVPYEAKLLKKAIELYYGEASAPAAPAAG